MKRMLAYSSIGQIGYVIIGIIVGDSNGRYASMITYMLFYISMNIGTFACIVLFGLHTGTAGTELADAYSPDTVIFSSPGKKESGPCLSPSVADHPLRPATDHRLGKLLPHQLANQTQAPPWVDSSFRSSAYRVLAAVSSCCPPPKGRFLRVTHPSTTGNTTSRPNCMCKACRQRSS
ncbi:hypothetical protein RYX36_018553 [Vicia faba]